MPRFHARPWLLACTLACSLSLDEDGTGSEPPVTRSAPTGNPFGGVYYPYGVGGTGGSGRSGGSGGSGGAATSGGSGGRAEEPGPGGRDGEPWNPVQVPVLDAAAPRCAGDAGACAGALCLSSDDCPEGLCVNARCRSFCDGDGDCPPGEACALGLCRTSPSPTWECFGAGDCASGEDCVSGGCLRRCSNDDHCSDSEDGAVCSLGYCGP